MESIFATVAETVRELLAQHCVHFEDREQWYYRYRTTDGQCYASNPVDLACAIYEELAPRVDYEKGVVPNNDDATRVWNSFGWRWELLRESILSELVCDVSEEASADRQFERIVRHFAQVRVVCNEYLRNQLLEVEEGVYLLDFFGTRCRDGDVHCSWQCESTVMPRSSAELPVSREQVLVGLKEYKGFVDAVWDLLGSEARTRAELLRLVVQAAADVSRFSDWHLRDLAEQAARREIEFVWVTDPREIATGRRRVQCRYLE